MKNVLKEYKSDQNKAILYERTLIFLAVFPVSITPIFGGWLGVEKWIITTIFNIGFLIVNAIFMRQLVRQSKLELDKLSELFITLSLLNSETANNAKTIFENNCQLYGLTKEKSKY